jgi:predicted PurR-regulated permease PerM
MIALMIVLVVGALLTLFVIAGPISDQSTDVNATIPQTTQTGQPAQTTPATPTIPTTTTTEAEGTVPPAP